jgi:flagellar M-ring protein FliF
MTRRTENIAYQTARVVRRTRLPQGGLKRMSISVLLDQNVRWEGVGAKARRILEPPAPETIKSIRDLVAAATGLSTDRGDQLIVESLPFESTLSAEPPGAPVAVPAPVATGFGFVLPAWIQALIQQKNPLLLGVVSGGTLLLLLFCAFMLFALRRKRKQVKMALAMREGRVAGELEGGIDDVEKSLSDRLAEQEHLKRKMEAEAINQLKLPPVTTKKAEVLTKHLVETAKKDPMAVAQILRTWLYDVD